MLPAIPKGSYLRSGFLLIFKYLSPIFKTNHQMTQPQDFVKFINNNPTDLSDMFNGMVIREAEYMLETLFDLSNVTIADRMFQNAKFSSLSLKMPRLRSARNMFEGADGRKLGACDFSGVVDATEMFKLSYINVIDNQDMPNVAIATNMFEGCHMYHFECFKFRSLTNVIGMFRGTSIFGVDSNGFNNIQVHTNIFDSATINCKLDGKLKALAQKYGFEKIPKNK